MTPEAHTQRIHRSCPICEASCGLVFEVDTRARKVLSVNGDPGDPRSRGYICPKAMAPAAVYEDPERVRRPLRRKGDGWEEISWDAAFELAASRLLAIRDAHGKDAIATYIGNPTGHNLGAMLWSAMFIRTLDTERVFTGATVDQYPKNLSSRCLYGDSWLFPIPDIDRSEYFLILGANPLQSNGSLMSAPNMRERLRRMRERGAEVVVVDPRRTETAAAADEHVFIRPGSDALWLFAIVETLFAEGLVRPGRLGEFTDGIEALGEIAAEFPAQAVEAATGIEAARTRRIAREFAAAQAAVCYGRFGTCTQQFGTLASWLIDAVNILTGNLDRPGGFMFPRPATGQSEPQVFDSGPVPYGRFRSRVRGFPEFDGQLPVAVMAEEIDSAGEQRVRAMITAAGNPVLSTPNGERLARALETLDFMVSVDIYVNETTSHADLILPTRVHLEESNFDFLFQTTSVRNMVRYSPRIFAPEPDSRSHWEVLAELAARLNGATAESFEEFMLGGALAMSVGPGTPHPQVSPEQARAELAGESGPERLLDLMLRSGPYGDGFDDRADGISLAKIAEVPHAVDLGPLEPRLPDILRTPGRRIDLVHELLVADLARLRGTLGASRKVGATAARAATVRGSGDPGAGNHAETAPGRGCSRRAENGCPGEDFLLIGRRQMRNMNSWLHNLEVLAKGPERCTLLINPCDARRVGLRDGSPARVSARSGEVEVPAELSDEMMPGVVCLPHGFGHGLPGSRLSVAAQRQRGVNSNQLADDLLLDLPSGTSVLNGLPVRVAAA